MRSEPTLVQFVTDLFILLVLGALSAAGGIIIVGAIFLIGVGGIELVQWYGRLLAR